ncbi:hypothetical protein PMZ80_010047 [Knufia obscura]|uniref:Deoxyribonuclease NucA/NucB domain-containing protein n=2 Tax=Knufia TaxID=430999 RepID=A0AAN8IAX0_9EURO|nr:hypothetical protein PMZ80_010047 [Knufia obscura]KAK5956135.1 hypothetical protein OHC33_002708 [Knufia fluminis]
MTKAFSFLLLLAWVLASSADARAIPEDSLAISSLDDAMDALPNNLTLQKRLPNGVRVVLTGIGWEYAAENWCWYLLCVAKTRTWTYDPLNANQRRQIDGAKSGLFKDSNMAKYDASRFNSSCTSADECPPASVIESGGGINVNGLPGTSPNHDDWAALFGVPIDEQNKQGAELNDAYGRANVGTDQGQNLQFWVDFTSNG